MNNNQNNWNYHNPTKILFGADRLKELPTLVGHAENILLVTTPGSTRRGHTDTICKLLSTKKITIIDNVEPNPDIDYIEAEYQHLSIGKHDTIIAIGGGSAIDTAKVFSYILTGSNINLRGDLESGKSFPSAKTLPTIAIPTTAGTGSEVTPFATVWDKLKHKKYSLATPELCPDIALLDPSLTISLPEEITIYTALDALSHALESIWNRNHNPISGAYATKSIGLILKHLPALIKEPANINYRSKIMEASLLSGLAISSTRTALAHSISYPVTARFNMPHGLACSFTLPAILEFNAHNNEDHFQELITSLGYESVTALKQALTQLFDTLNVKTMLNKYINSTNDLLSLTPEMLTPGRADNNLRLVDENRIKDILIK